jgi:hypothetical protein
MTKPSARQIARRSAILPALAAALVPKCPFCVAAYLSLFGVSTGAAGAIAPVVRAGLLVIASIAIALILLPLGRLALRSRDHAPLLVATAAACAALALSVAGAPLPIRIAGLLALLVAWLWAERRLHRATRSESCCASKLHGSTTAGSA